jgi:ACS family tartrate transporter-like MFS transporter
MDPAGIREPTLLHKVWWRILPFVFILFIINMLDRVNIGYTALEMNADLGIDPSAFGLIAGVFFIGYFLFEIPSTQILARVGARVWLGRIMVSWGIVVSAMAFVQTPVQLGILRFLLGVAEAGFFPGIILYLSFWFTRDAIGRSYAVFIAAMPVALVIGSPVSTWIIEFVTWFGIAGWRWVFMLQGLLAVIAGICTLIFLPSLPRAARWLDTDEKEWLESNLKPDQVMDGMPLHIPFRQLLRDRMVPVLTVCLFLLYFSLFGIVFWLPQIVQSFEITASVFGIGLLLMVPYAAATVVMFLWGKHSDRTGERVFHVILPVVLSAAAFVMDALVADPTVSLVFLGVALIALFSAFPPFWAIAIAHISPGLRPSGTAFINSFASLGSFSGPVIFGAFVQYSRYDAVLGLVALAGALVLCCLLLLHSVKRPAMASG